MFIKVMVMALLFTSGTMAQEIVQAKNKTFVIKKEDNASYTKGESKRFYNEEGKLSIIAAVVRFNKNLCLLKVEKFRKGLVLKKGMSLFLNKPTANEIISNTNEEQSDSTRDTPADKEDSSTSKKYLIKAGLGGQNSASVFGEFTFLRDGKLTYGLVLSNRIVGRDDVELSGLSYGGRLDYNFKEFTENGFLMSLNLGMASLSYNIAQVEGIDTFSVSETVPYFTLMAGYRKWLKKVLLTLAGGISYMGYSDSLEDPSDGTVVTNPYVTIDLALEASLGFTF